MPAVTTGEKIKHFRNGTFIDMSFKIHSTKFNSYHEWRKASNYSKTQNTKFVDLISSNTHMFKYEECIQKLNKCLEANIHATDLVIAILYLSCHHFSPHAMRLIKYLLNNHNVNLNVTSISSPQFMIPHVAAMNGDTDLVQIYYNLDGNINATDGRGVFPIAIAIAERRLKVCEYFLWMDTMINTEQLSMFDERSNDDVAPFIAAFVNFIQKIDLSKQCLYDECSNIPNELIEVLTDYILPINAYNGIKELLNKFKYNRFSDWDEIEQIVRSKLKTNDEGQKSVATIGIDWENSSNCINKMITNIYVKPTRIEGRVQYRNYNDTYKQILTVTIFCSAIMAVSAIIWRQRQK